MKIQDEKIMELGLEGDWIENVSSLLEMYSKLKKHPGEVPHDKVLPTIIPSENGVDRKTCLRLKRR